MSDADKVNLSSVKVITIDGPSASGKTSVSRELALRLGCRWISTGAFYRGLAMAALRQGVIPTDRPALQQLIDQELWEVRPEKERTAIYFRGEDVTAEAMTEKVGAVASQVSQYPELRSALLKAQRECALGGPCFIAEGRDCGTVVFPEALVKVYLTAHSESRAARRSAEEGRSTAEIHEQQRLRDTQDSQRAVAPLEMAPGAHRVDTSQMSLLQVVDEVERLVKSSRGFS